MFSYIIEYLFCAFLLQLFGFGSFIINFINNALMCNFNIDTYYFIVVILAIIKYSKDY